MVKGNGRKVDGVRTEEGNAEERGMGRGMKNMEIDMTGNKGGKPEARRGGQARNKE